MASTLARIRQQRLDKVKKLRDMGIDPYPAKIKDDRKKIDKLVENYSENKGNKFTIVGRIMSWREHGSLKFAQIQDVSGKMQLIIRKDKLENNFSEKKQFLGWKELNLIDVGDFVEVHGMLVESKTKEISIDVDEFKLLAKTLRPLPEKWKGLEDTETKLRRRYLDMTMDPDVRELFKIKSRFIKNMREYMQNKGFVEIRTPVLEHTTGGADANPFITHHKALDTDFYLRISLELPLKRAIGGGFEKVFEIGPVFRNEGIDDEHLQDYDMMEFYWAYKNYKDSMLLVEDLYRYIVKNTFNKTKFQIGEHEVDFAGKWKRIDYVKTIENMLGINVLKTDSEEIKEKLNSLKIKFNTNDAKPRLVDTLWKHIRKEISGPVFLINQPKFISPLAKSQPDEDKKEITQRYQVIIAGSEMGNGYSELNDPRDQYERFLKQQKMRDKGDEDAQMMDLDFVEMLEYGMPPTTGFGVSERLFSFLVNKPIRKTVMFPQMKRFVDDTTKEIYDLGDDGKEIRSFAKDYAEKKIVIVLDKTLKSWELANVIGHLSVSIGQQTENLLGRKVYKDASGVEHKGISRYGFITLGAKSAKLRKLIQDLRKTRLLFVDYPKEMLDTRTDDDLNKAINEKKESDMEYIGVAIYGSKSEIDALTKEFELWN